MLCHGHCYMNRKFCEVWTCGFYFAQDINVKYCDRRVCMPICPFVCLLVLSQQELSKCWGSYRIELHAYTRQKVVVATGDSFWGRVALKIVVTTLVCVKLVINLWRFVPRKKIYSKKQPVAKTTRPNFIKFPLNVTCG